MARRLKVFKTHIGFYDLVVAAPSMAAAAKAWHASPRLFAQGFAEVTSDGDAVAAALEQPGTVLKRPHGKAGPYKAEPDAPPMPKVSAAQKRKTASARDDDKRRLAAEKKAAAAAAREEKKKAAAELAAIEEEEDALRRRRRALQAKFHPRPV